MPLFTSPAARAALLTSLLAGSGCALDDATAPVALPSEASQFEQIHAALLPADPGSTGLAVQISSYLGGGAFEHARDVTTDAAGNVYVVGGTMSSGFPTTAGAYQRVHNQGRAPSQSGINPMDAFVMKLSPGGQIIWSTFLGGRNYDRAYAVEVDGQGNVYVAGRAGSGFPVTAGAFQTAFRGGQEATFYGPQDGFICKLNPAGSALIYCSYFGTSDPRIIRDLAVDGSGNAYLASSANQSGLPSTWFANAFQKTRSGGVDGVVAKVNATGTQVLWATYVGGRSDEGHGENSIRLDAAGNVYFLQNTNSSGMPTPNGFDRTFGGAVDVHLSKLSPDGRRLLYGTYIGGSQNDFVETHALALDGAGNAYVGVTTQSTNFPTTPGALQRVYGGSGASGAGKGTNYPFDVGVVKISPAGSLLAGTYLGGHCGEGGEGIAVDAQQNVYVTGGTYSSNYPATAAPFLNRSGAADAMVTKLTASFSSLAFSQRVGGSGNEYGRSIHVDASGALYVVGETASSNLPTLNPLRSSFGGNRDVLLLKLLPTG